jgi:hypothetical protein
VRRITLGWSYALHFPGGHFPFQGTVLGPAALLYAAAGGALESAQCIALVSLAYGVVAFAALVVLWRRFFPGAAGWWATLLYPLFAGPDLADLSVYSVSATNAFLFGGSALLAEGLARLCHARARALALCLGASLSFGLGLYTHLIPALWSSIPAFVVLAHLLAAPPMRCERCASAAWNVRLSESAIFGVVLPLAGALLGLLASGHELQRAGVAPTAWSGLQMLVLRDVGIVKPLIGPLKVVREHLLLVTGGLGLFFALAGLLRWARREGAYAWGSVALTMASIAITSRQYH